jgi:hypothetical protein
LRHKTDRGDQDEHDGGLTSGGGQRSRPHFAVNRGGLVRARLQKGGGARLRSRGGGAACAAGGGALGRQSRGARKGCSASPLWGGA